MSASPAVGAVPGASRLKPVIAAFTASAIGLHLLLRLGPWAPAPSGDARPDLLPLFAALLFGGAPLVLELLVKLLRREFGSDLLAGISIGTSVLLGEYLAGALVV